MGNEQHSQQKTPEIIRNLGPNRNLVINAETKKEMITVQRVFSTSEQLQSYLATKICHLKISHPYYLNQAFHQVITQANICSTVHKLVQYFTYEQHTLRNELANRKKFSKVFTYQQIWSIICSCVLPMAHLTRNQILHYTLNPNDIIIDQNGQIKIISNDLSQNMEDIILKSYYYSPEHLRSFKLSNIPQLTNKSGVYTLGMTILQVIFLEPMDKFYDYTNFYINLDGITETIQKVEDQYLRMILQKMLKPQSYERITFTELEDMLYFILQKQSQNQKNQQISESQNQNQQIQKLEQSIFKIQKGKIQDQPIQSSQTISKENTLQIDHEDTPNELVMSQSAIDLEKINQDDEAFHQNDNQNQISNAQHFSRINYPKETQFFLQQNSHILNTPIFIPIHHNDCKPYYVTENLSRGKYEGYKLNNMRHGFGTFYYFEGGKYIGEWVTNKMEGRGSLYYKNSQIAYEGEWKSDKLNGYGVLYNETPNYFSESYDYKSLHIIDDKWIKYEGNFINDEKNGEGTLFLANGEFYRGYFKKDFPHGNGIYRMLSGGIVKGNWILGVFQEIIS